METAPIGARDMKVILKGTKPQMFKQIFSAIATAWSSSGSTNGTLAGGVVAWTSAASFAKDLTTFFVWLTTDSGRLAEMPEKVALAYSGWVGGLIEGGVFILVMVAGTVFGGLLSTAVKVEEVREDRKEAVALGLLPKDTPLSELDPLAMRAKEEKPE